MSALCLLISLSEMNASYVEVEPTQSPLGAPLTMNISARPGMPYRVDATQCMVDRITCNMCIHCTIVWIIIKVS